LKRAAEDLSERTFEPLSSRRRRATSAVHAWPDEVDEPVRVTLGCELSNVRATLQHLGRMRACERGTAAQSRQSLRKEMTSRCSVKTMEGSSKRGIAGGSGRNGVRCHFPSDNREIYKTAASARRWVASTPRILAGLACAAGDVGHPREAGGVRNRRWLAEILHNTRNEELRPPERLNLHRRDALSVSRPLPFVVWPVPGRARIVGDLCEACGWCFQKKKTKQSNTVIMSVPA